MADKNTLKELLDREFEGLAIMLWGKAQRTGVTLRVLIGMRLIQGTSKEVIKDELITDLNTGGRIFGEFRNAVKATAVGSVNRLRDVAEFSELGVITKYRWSAILVNTCPDCIDRHGKVFTWGDWETRGLPRTGATICRENCKCVLLPAKTSALEPIIRGKK